VKPEPPKEKVAAVETPKKEPEKKPPEKFDVDTLLKTLKPNAPAPKSDEPPQKQTATPQQQASVNPQAPRGPQLTTSELDVVKRQIMNRWNYDPGAKGVNEVVVEMRIYLRPDGTVERAEILSNDRMNDPVYRSVAEALRRAALSYSQTPLTLPRDKYETWKTIHITANPKDAV
jgi:outer membrane biosynthesis protein TonB